ncbi:serine protein kinase RIO [Candidatus Micrarchaeota archaeon]|nr:serine protein kinase RIO [Candidatus Micrarchaeota archaeon]
MSLREREFFKIYQGIFDGGTMRTLTELARKRFFDSIDFPISTGKEADVYRASKGPEFLAVKVYRVETSNFKAMQNYLIGDKRFGRVKSSKRGIVEAWCQKEFRNLSDAMDAGVNVPYPIKAEKNVLLMGFLGERDGSPFPMLKSVRPKNPAKLIKTVLSFVKKLWKHGLVHGDLNEFNIMMDGEKPILIDIGQAMSTSHPMALELLERDLLNVSKLARRYNVPFDYEKELRSLVK